MLEKPCLLDYLDNVDVIVGLENVTEYKVKVHGMWNITVLISPGCVRLVKFILCEFLDSESIIEYVTSYSNNSCRVMQCSDPKTLFLYLVKKLHTHIFI